MIKMPRAILATLLGCAFSTPAPALPPSQNASTLWASENLMAWGVVPYDAKKRTPEQRAQMLEHLDLPEAGQAIERAVAKALACGRALTADLGGRAGTREATDAVLEHL